MDVADPKLALTFVGAGSGESIIVNVGGRLVGLVDSCVALRAVGPGVARPLLASVLERCRDPIFAFALLTHPHLDHFAGMHALLRQHASSLKRVFFFNGITEAEVAKAFERQARRHAERSQMHHRYASNYSKLRETFETLDDAQRATASDGTGMMQTTIRAPGVAPIQLEIRCLAPAEAHARRFASQVKYVNVVPYCTKRGRPVQSCNAVSVVTVLNFGTTRILLGGDAEEDAWRQIVLKQPAGSLASHLLKVSHHGSVHGIPLDIVRELARPPGEESIAVIMPSYAHGLPDEEMLVELRRAFSSVIVTSTPLEEVDRSAPVRAHFPGARSVRAQARHDAPAARTIVFDHEGQSVPPPWPDWVYDTARGSAG